MGEEYLADHFPGFPVMPGVLMLEALIQCGAWLMRYSEDFRYSTVLLKEARAIRFNHFVRPGETLCVTVKVHQWNGADCVMKGRGTVEGQSAIDARLTLHQFNRSEGQPHLKEADRTRIQQLRNEFAQICLREILPEEQAG